MTGHRYGPHDPAAHATRRVKVLGPGKWPDEYDRPLPDVVQRQIERANTIAYVQSEARHG